MTQESFRPPAGNDADPTVLSVNIALPEKVSLDGRRKVLSGIFKKPVTGKIFLDVLGLQGDGSADPVHHGGPDKAVCAYPADYFPYWEKVTGKKLSYGAFGENLSLTGLSETKIHIGDVFSLGEAEVQCSQPRQPCHKLNKIFEFQEMACRIQKTGFSGWYFRVLKPGWVEPGVALKLVAQGDRRVTVDAANDLRHNNKKDIEKLREILIIAALSDSWREYFSKALAKLYTTLLKSMQKEGPHG